MFGLVDLAFLVFLGWMVTKGISRYNRRVGSGGPRRWDEPEHPAIPPGEPPQRSVTEELNTRVNIVSGLPPAQPQPQPQPTVPPKVQREQKMLELRRQYVADEITVEQYEAEIDKLIRE